MREVTFLKELDGGQVCDLCKCVTTAFPRFVDLTSVVRRVWNQGLEAVVSAQDSTVAPFRLYEKARADGKLDVLMTSYLVATENPQLHELAQQWHLEEVIRLDPPGRQEVNLEGPRDAAPTFQSTLPSKRKSTKEFVQPEGGKSAARMKWAGGGVALIVIITGGAQFSHDPTVQTLGASLVTSMRREDGSELRRSRLREQAHEAVVVREAGQRLKFLALAVVVVTSEEFRQDPADLLERLATATYQGSRLLRTERPTGKITHLVVSPSNWHMAIVVDDSMRENHSTVQVEDVRVANRPRSSLFQLGTRACFSSNGVNLYIQRAQGLPEWTQWNLADWRRVDTVRDPCPPDARPSLVPLKPRDMARVQCELSESDQMDLAKLRPGCTPAGRIGQYGPRLGSPSARSGGRVASADGSRQVRVSDETHLSPDLVLDHSWPVSDVFFAHEDYLITVDQSGAIRVWDGRPRGPCTILSEYAPRGQTLAFSVHGQYVEYGPQRWAVRADASAPAELQEHARFTSDLSSDERHRLRIVEGRVEVVDEGTHRPLLGLHHSEVGARAARYSPDDTLIATLDCDAAVRLWDASRGTLMATLTGHHETIEDLAFSPDGEHLATVAGGEVRLWSLAVVRNPGRFFCDEMRRMTEGLTGPFASVREEELVKRALESCARLPQR